MDRETFVRGDGRCERMYEIAKGRQGSMANLLACKENEGSVALHKLSSPNKIE